MSEESEQPPVIRRLGGLKGMVLRMDDSFDDELEDFADYAPFS